MKYKFILFFHGYLKAQYSRLHLRLYGSRLRSQGSGFKVSGSGFGVQGFGFGVEGLVLIGLVMITAPRHHSVTTVTLSLQVVADLLNGTQEAQNKSTQ